MWQDGEPVCERYEEENAVGRNRFFRVRPVNALHTCEINVRGQRDWGVKRRVNDREKEREMEEEGKEALNRVGGE